MLPLNPETIENLGPHFRRELPSAFETGCLGFGDLKPVCNGHLKSAPFHYGPRLGLVPLSREVLRSKNNKIRTIPNRACEGSILRSFGRNLSAERVDEAHTEIVRLFLQELQELVCAREGMRHSQAKT